MPRPCRIGIQCGYCVDASSSRWAFVYAAMRLSLRESREQILGRQIRERVEEEVGSGGVEAELARDLVRHGDGEDSRRLRGADAVGRVLEGNRLVGADAEDAQRVEVEVRRRLRAFRDAVRGANRIPPRRL